jgi:fructokinase
VAELDGDGLASYSFSPDGTSDPNLTAGMVPRALGADVIALHIGTLGLVLEPMATSLTELMRREGGRRLVMLDPNVRPALVADTAQYRRRLEMVMARSTIVKVSEEDLTWLFPGLDHERAADRIAAAGVPLVVVTLGAHGAFAIASGLRVRVRAPLVEVVDTIGAGDAFGAALLAWLHDHHALRPDLALQPHEVEAALGFACLAASITCTRAGAEPPRRAEMNSRAS